MEETANATLADVLRAVTTVYRKGAEIVKREAEGVSVTEVWDYPHADEAPTDHVVDVHFVRVAVDHDGAEAAWPIIEAALRAYPEPARLAGGPSYIELAGVLEVEQETVLRLLAVGADLGKWTVITPALFGITGPEADRMAGMGLVNMSGWTSSVPA